MLQYEKEDVEQIMKWTNLSYTQAEKYLLDVYKDSQSENVFDLLDCIELEVKSKQNSKRNYVQSAENSEKKTRKPKTVKISDEKQEIFGEIVEFLSKKYQFSVETDNKLVKIYKNGKEFKLNLSETRQKK